MRKYKPCTGETAGIRGLRPPTWQTSK